MKKRLLAVLCAALLLGLSGGDALGAAKAASAHQYEEMWGGGQFDLAYFKKRQNLFDKRKKQWKITASREDAFGTVVPVTSKAKQSYKPVDCRIYPQILLDSYGTEGFMPLLNLRITCKSTYNYAFSWASVKFGKKEYKFNGILASRLQKDGVSTEILDLFVDERTQGMVKQWTGWKGDVRLHLEGRGGYIEFIIDKPACQNIKALFQDYEKAGGSAAAYRIQQSPGMYTVYLSGEEEK